MSCSVLQCVAVCCSVFQYTYTNMYMYIPICTGMCRGVIYVCIYVYIYMQCIYICVHMYVYMYIYAYMHIYVYTPQICEENNVCLNLSSVGRQMVGVHVCVCVLHVLFACDVQCMWCV